MIHRFRAVLSRTSADISVIDSLIQIDLQGIQNNENNLEEEEQSRRTYSPNVKTFGWLPEVGGRGWAKWARGVKVCKLPLRSW